MHVCVIGAGVVGVTTAWYLANRGWRVTLMDACQFPAQGASYANGGQLSYSYVSPLASPESLANLPLWLLRRDSPLRMIPRWDPHQWRWLLAFLAACQKGKAQESTAHMIQLAELSRKALADLLTHTPLEFSHSRNGKMILYRSPSLFQRARTMLAHQLSPDGERRVLGRDECIDHEPALAPIQHSIAGAIYTPSEESGDCRQFTEGLFRRLSVMSNVDIYMSTPIRALQCSGGRVERLLHHHRAPVRADAFVIAAGMGSQSLLSALHINPKLYPLKGYSLDISVQAEQIIPRISVTDYERRTVYARLNGNLRVAAMVGIGLRGDHVEADRLALLRRQIRELLPDLNLSRARAWAGYRPTTPDGKPIIGKVPDLKNLWLNIGHGSLGFTLACGSAKLLEAMLAKEPLPIDASPFALR